MSQHDGVLDDAAGAAFRSDLNNFILAALSLNAGTAAPSPTYPNQLWVDTTNSLLKKRNNANAAWNTLGSMDTLLATTSVSGLVAALATTTEVLAGTNATKAVTPEALAALWGKGGDIASASTISIGEGGCFVVTGTTTITDIDFATDHSGRGAWLIFASVLTLTHNASTLILPAAGANITTVAGDSCYVSSQDGSDQVRVVAYQRADGTALVASGSIPAAASQAQQESASATNVYVSPGRQQYHPSAAKAWIKVSNGGTPTSSQSYNVASLTDNGAGDVSVVISTDFSAATYAYAGAAQAFASNDPSILTQHDSVNPAAGSCRFRTCRQSNGGNADVDFSAFFFGDQ